MPRIDIIKETPVIRTARVMQTEGIFDVPPSQRSGERWSVDLDLPDGWNVGVIVGPSGSGKTTIARALFGDYFVHGWSWPEDKSILDGFPLGMSIKDITALLSSVGFSSPPSWVRPFHVLSNGEQFRVTMARTLAEMHDLAVVDEFTSVVDRTVAQIGSAAIAKTVRRRQQRMIVVTCHYDVLEWLEPDWVYEPATNTLTVGRLLQRPRIELEIARVHTSAWELFKHHHYLSSDIHKAARCFVAFWRGVPVAFASVLPFPHGTIRAKREHRTVCLPDYQGVGIGNAISATIGQMVRGMGYRYLSSTGNPAMVNARNKTGDWKMIRSMGFSEVGRKKGAIGSALRSQSRPWTGINNRLTASFEYIGPAMSRENAMRLWHG